MASGRSRRQTTAGHSTEAAPESVNCGAALSRHAHVWQRLMTVSSDGSLCQTCAWRKNAAPQMTDSGAASVVCLLLAFVEGDARPSPLTVMSLCQT